MTILGITLLIGVTTGVFLGVPLGRAWERVSPKTGKRKDDIKKKKKI
jgi:cytochrome bd-type quinol oxidase subunit 1